MSWLTNVSHTHWFVLGLILLIAEISTGTTYLLWPAVAAGVTGFAVMALGLDLLTATAVFAVLTIVLTLLGRPLLRNLRVGAGAPSGINERGASLVGARAVAVHAFHNGVGSVKIGDSVWRALSAEEIAPGQAVEIVAVDGASVTVKPAG
jgi:membrane protein implicated in regulation of membrane protease activity